MTKTKIEAISKLLRKQPHQMQKGSYEHRLEISCSTNCLFPVMNILFTGFVIHRQLQNSTAALLHVQITSTSDRAITPRTDLVKRSQWNQSDWVPQLFGIGWLSLVMETEAQSKLHPQRCTTLTRAQLQA